MTNSTPPLPDSDCDAIISLLCREDIDAIRNADTLPASALRDEEYEPGVPGRACLSCNSAWPATEPDDAHWHHASGCGVAQ